jgi:electron transfer flavoprotein beta subunit
MKIAVLIKQVPAKDAPIVISQDRLWIDESELEFAISEPDDYALEAALQLRDAHGGEVVAISLGPGRVEKALRVALAKGADRAIHIGEDSPHALDALQIAGALAGAAKNESFDLVLSGLQSDDMGLGETGVIFAELLDMAHSTVVVELGLEGSTLSLKRELEGGWFQNVQVDLPAVLSIQSGMNKPRYTTLKGIIAAKRKKIAEVALADVMPPDIQATVRTTGLSMPQHTKNIEFLEGGPAEQAAALVEKLKNDIRVL